MAWDLINIAGINGIVSLVASLLWWGLRVPEEDATAHKGWLDAVADVTWALGCTNASYEAGDECGAVQVIPTAAFAKRKTNWNDNKKSAAKK